MAEPKDSPSGSKCTLDTTRPADYTMTFTRYKDPIPDGVLHLDTNADLRAAVDSFQKAGTDTCFDEVNGGYYMLATDGRVLGVVSDAMCAELDARQAHVARWVEENERREREGLEPLESCGCCDGEEKREEVEK